jgi:hypothetical protein
MVKRAYLAGGAAFLMLGIWLCIQLVRIPRSSSRPSISFLGFTNDDRFGMTGRFGVFSFANANVIKTTCQPKCVEYKSGTEWITTNLPIFQVNTSGDERSTAPAGCMFYTPPPDCSGPWRIRIECREVRRGREGFKERMTDMIAGWRKSKPGTNVTQTTYGGLAYEVVSPEVNE